MTSKRKSQFEWENPVLILRTIKFNWLHILHTTIRNSNKSYVKNIQWFLPIPFSICQVRVSWLLDSQNAAFNDTRAPFNFVWYRGWVWERVESNAGQFTSFRFSPRPSLLSSAHGWVCRVLIKIVTRLRWQDYLGVWSDNRDILQWKTKEALCRAAMCHPPPAGPWLTVIILLTTNRPSWNISKKQLFAQIQCFPVKIRIEFATHCSEQISFTSKLLIL